MYERCCVLYFRIREIFRTVPLSLSLFLYSALRRASLPAEEAATRGGARRVSRRRADAAQLRPAAAATNTIIINTKFKHSF